MAELTDEQKEALSEAVGAFDSPEALADALQNEHNDYFSEIWQRGHSTATGQKKGDIKDLQDEVESLKAEVTRLEQEKEKIQEDQPDLQGLRKGWEEDELAPVKAERDEWKEKFLGGERERAERKVIDHLAEKLDDRWLAERIVKQDANGRINIDEEGNAEFFRPDGKTPYTPGENQSAPELMAEGFYRDVPEPYRPDKAQGGKRENDVRSNGQKKEKVEGVTRKQLIENPAEMAKFIGKYDSREEGIEAFQSLPNE